MSATEDVARMLTLVPWFLERPGASLDEAAEAFGVPAPVLRKDLGHLDFCGLPGLGGGALFDVSLIGDRVVLSMADELRRPLRPTPTEALRLVLTVDAVAEALGSELPALQSGVEKIRVALGVGENIADVLAAPDVSGLEVARTSLRDGRRVAFAYQGRKDVAPTPRTVDPWALHVQDGVWYLQGHDLGVGQPRTFRLDRMVDLRATDEPVSVPSPGELPPPRYSPSTDDIEVVLEVSPPGRWLQEVLTIDRTTQGADGSLRLHLRSDAPRWIARLVIMAAGQARVVEPEELRTMVLDLASSGQGQPATDPSEA